MNGSMREARDGSAELEDIDKSTFVRFCEYAYMGDYTPAQRPVIPVNVDRAGSVVRNEEYVEDIFNFGVSKTKKKKGVALFDNVNIIEESCIYCGSEAPTQNVWDEFKRRDYSVVSSKFRPGANLEECDDNIGPFLGHARVYVFADRYDITALRVLALDKLHQALCSSKVPGDQMGKVVELAQFSYSNENTRDNGTGEDKDALRSIVVLFIVCVFEDIVKENAFLELMMEGGSFARDLTDLLGKRISRRA